MPKGEITCRGCGQYESECKCNELTLPREFLHEIMEAKDTVMTKKVSWISLNQAGLEKMLLEQAEISFKAGRQEVIEWVEKHSMLFGLEAKTKWQEFLRSEGIE